MPFRPLLSAAAIVLAFDASAAFAADGCRTLASGAQRCDTPSDAVAAEPHSPLPQAATGCRTIVNGIQKCDVPTGVELSSAAVAAATRKASAADTSGCRSIGSGVQRCDVPVAAAVRPEHAAVLATSH